MSRCDARNQNGTRCAKQAAFCVRENVAGQMMEFRTCRAHAVGFAHHPTVAGELVENKGGSHGRSKSDRVGPDHVRGGAYLHRRTLGAKQ